MPTYSYRRADGSTFDVQQRITEPPLTTCPTTGQSVSRMITGGAGLVFKGSGFYLTDYARKGGSATTPGPSANGESKTESTPKPEPAPRSESAGGTSTSKD